MTTTDTTENALTDEQSQRVESARTAAGVLRARTPMGTGKVTAWEVTDLAEWIYSGTRPVTETDSDREIEQLRVQLAGCGAAALGAADVDRVQRGDYGWSDSYQQVVDLFARYRALATGPLPAFDESGEPFTFTHREGEPLTIEQAVHEALGAASVCWESMSGTGVFQDHRARAIAAALLRFISETTIPSRGPRAGDRVTDGGIPGVLVTCQTCSGDGLLHQPDHLPATAEPTPETTEDRS